VQFGFVNRGGALGHPSQLRERKLAFPREQVSIGFSAERGLSCELALDLKEKSWLMEFSFAKLLHTLQPSTDCYCTRIQKKYR
jgi:hypothetical protein